MKFVAKLFSQYLLGLVGIILISSIPAFFQSVWDVVYKIFTPSEWSFRLYLNYEYVERPLFTYVYDHYTYSMTILFSALFIAFVVGFLLALSTFQLPSTAKKVTHRLLNSLEAFPDILFIFMLQILVVWFYKNSGILLFEFVYLGEEKIYLSPILSLCILPTILFYKVILLLLEEEWSKNYVQLAKSRGFSRMYILLQHCVRNIKRNLVIQSKPIIWATLSSLLVVEYLHNFYGIVRLIFFDSRPFTITVALVMIFTPFYILFQLLEWGLKMNYPSPFEDNARLFRGKKLFSGKSFLRRLTFNKVSSQIHSFWGGLLKLLRKPKFVLGMLYVGGLAITSLLYSYFKDPPVERLGVFQDESGFYHAPPHPPGVLVLGSDTYGYPIFEMLASGAKYTILFSLLIAFLRILSGYILTIPYIFWLGERSRNVISKVADGMQFLPLSLIAYVILVNVVIFDEDKRRLAESQIVPNTVLEVMVLVVFVIPVMLNTIGKESNAHLKSEYVQSALILGASKSRIFFNHISISLFPKIVYLFGQQIIQVLQVFVHLGVFGIFLGGGLKGQPDQSLIYEWTAMFENMRIGIMTGQYWLIIPVLILYIFLILSIQAITRSVIEVQQRKIGIDSAKPKKKTERTRTDSSPSKDTTDKKLFTFL
ncbi:ABC transporter permease subunit [Halobacillus naozhouensis]|uniref:ABC transporter permease subunit n=1 Tax=Halobacillus naozhouensis TaxID=554880 RepID=A0ABY8J190_9BACI|nr:ABC transporter permease subunit [Halobacillus naozhouensis]WFT74661.1 ABC transporter permease subunit [Halobacillus naozhouensis]